MPEIAVHKYRNLEFRKDEIRLIAEDQSSHLPGEK
jgi:hypothetical protein